MVSIVIIDIDMSLQSLLYFKTDGMSPEFADFEYFIDDYRYAFSAISACFFVYQHRMYLSLSLP